jgi:hypothetical protein
LIILGVWERCKKKQILCRSISRRGRLASMVVPTNNVLPSFR